MQRVMSTNLMGINILLPITFTYQGQLEGSNFDNTPFHPGGKGDSVHSHHLFMMVGHLGLKSPSNKDVCSCVIKVWLLCELRGGSSMQICLL